MTNLPFRHARAALAAIALLTVTCRDVNVTAVDVARIEISPDAPSVEVAQTTPLSARVLSSAGRELQGRTVQWQSRDPSIATVSASGVVSGIAAGTTRIRAATEGVADSVSVTVTARPQIQLAATSVQFSAVQGAASPAAQSIAVSNGGGGSLTGLSAAVTYDAGQATGWLTATLAATTAPTTLALAVDTDGLAAGGYGASVRVQSPVAANDGVTLRVSLAVAPPGPAISLQPALLTFTAVQGGASPAAQQVAVTNLGGGTLGQLTLSVAYPGGQPSGWLAPSLDRTTAPATLSIAVTPGALAPGTYTGSVRVASPVATNSPQSVEVTLEVGEAAPAIAVGTTVISFAADVGGANPASQNVAVTNAGGATLGGLTAGIEYGVGQPTGWLTTALAGTTAPTTLTLAAATGALPIGAHTARVLVAAPTAVNSPVTITVTFSIGDVPPSAPTSLTAAVVSASQVHLEWGAAGGTVAEYRIERSTGTTGTWTQLASISAAILTYESTGLAASTQYLYRVRACNDAGCSPYSNEATATTHPLPPGAPGTLSATAVSSSAIDLAWGAASGTVAEYVIERRTGGGAYAVIDSVAGATTLQDTGLAPATSYTYRVRACNPGGCSAYGNEASATTLPAIPGAPASLAATAASSAAIDLSWTAGSGTVDEYRIERRAAAETSFTLRATIAGTTTAWQDAGLTAATAYTYRVQACNDSGCSPFSNESSATTLPLPPGAPAALSATTVSSSQIDLAWSAASGTVDEYVIERRTGAGTYAVVDTVTATSFSNTGLAASTTYTYRVRACNSGGCSPYSNEAVATTYPPAPGAPTALVATTTSSTQIQLGWTAATGTVDVYVIERRTGPGTFAVIDSVVGTSYFDSGLTPATGYTYHVQACNAGGCSDFSNQATATTFPPPPGTPGTLTATTISASRIDLAWGASSGTVAGYVIERRTGAGAYAVIDTVTGATTFQDLGLAAGTGYVYRVQACNAGGCSAYGNEATATTLPLPPGAPALTATAVDSSAIDLNWSGATGTVESYRVERVSPDAEVIAILDDLITSHRDVGREPATLHTYRVQACNAGGCSAFSNEVSLPTQPRPPASLTATTVDSVRIDLAWSAVSGVVDEYRIERSLAAGGPYVQIGVANVPTVVFSANDLESATTYFFQVRACNAGGCSVASPVASATTSPANSEIPGP